MQALSINTTGFENTANGLNALFSNTTGNDNAATGFDALFSNTTGFENTANGFKALYSNTGAGNTALGYLAGSALTTGDDNIDIGNEGVAGDSGVIRIGRSFISATYIAGISGATAIGGDAVYITPSGHLGTLTSSARFKQNIEAMGESSDVLLSLRPVTFRYKPELDPKGLAQFGLVAEEVAKVDPALVTRDAQGEPYSVRYEAVNAMLLNEFLKEHRKMQKLEATAAKQQKQIEALTTGLQKVSDQLQVSKSAPQIVVSNQ